MDTKMLDHSLGLDFNLKEINVIPRWIYDYLTRNNVEDIFNYTALRNKLSLNDIAVLLCFRDLIKLNENRCDYYLFDKIDSDDFIFANDDERSEFNISVSPLSQSKEIAHNILSRLNSYRSVDNNSLTYTLINKQDRLLIIIDDGFLLSIKNKDFKNNFIKDCLKEIDKYTNVKESTYSNIFNEYLKYCLDTKDTLQSYN